MENSIIIELSDLKFFFFLLPILKRKLFFAPNLEHSAELDLSSQKMGCVSKGMVQFFARTRRRMKNTLICELGCVN